MRQSEPNPFRDATFLELSRACNEAIRELEERRKRTREEKEAFAKRLRFLLIALAMRFSTGDTIPGSPEMPLSRDARLSVAEAFLPWYQRTKAEELQAVRRFTLWRAANFVLGKQAYRFLEPPDGHWQSHPGWIGTRDDECLLVVLRRLDRFGEDRQNL